MTSSAPDAFHQPSTRGIRVQSNLEQRILPIRSNRDGLYRVRRQKCSKSGVIFKRFRKTFNCSARLTHLYPVYTLSNTNAWHAEYLEARSDWMCIFSASLLFTRFWCPQTRPAHLQLACQAVNVEPARALLIDDRQEDLDGAEAIGMQSILATSPHQLTGDLAFVRFATNPAQAESPNIANAPLPTIPNR